MEIERVGMTAPVAGRSALLVAIRYPIQLAGQPLELAVALDRPGRRARYRWTVGVGANAGAARRPERRRAFTFVHAIRLNRQQTREARRGLAARRDGAGRGSRRPLVRVSASGALDVNRDGIVDLDSRDHELHRLPLPGASRRLCSSVPQLRTRPGAAVTVALPRCGAALRWQIARPRTATASAARGAGHGAAAANGGAAGTAAGVGARIHRGRLVLRPGRRFRGVATVRLLGTPVPARRAQASAGSRAARAAANGPSGGAARITVPVQVQALRASAEGVSVRAMGDSVTAGFGYFDDGAEMSFGELLGCRPGEAEYNDACSSNSTVRSNASGVKLEYAPDYGLANNVSWAAQWANAHGVKDYANFAVSGSEPKDWAPAGQFYETTERIESEDPDYILMTIGANPLLSNVLFGLGNMGCAISSDILGGFRECVERAFGEVGLHANLTRLYRELVQHTEATVYLMQYHLSVPASALAYTSTQIAEMGAVLNEEIATVAREVNSKRLRVVTPPHFNVGVDITPVYPNQYTCSYFEYGVDGPSVQSTPTQDELEVDHPLSFCEGPAGGGPPWVIGGDTGIHPSAAGYAQMAAQVPAP